MLPGTRTALLRCAVRSDPFRQIYLDEARVIAGVMGGVHHSRKQGHQQVSYPETVKLLGSLQASRSSSQATLSAGSSSSSNSQAALSSTSSKQLPYNQTRVYEAKEMRLKDFQEQMTQHIVAEHHMNDRKRNYNREVGRKAVVNQVISGTGPMPKVALFPQGATHEQILALTNTLKAPDANKLPPEVPRLRKWKGDHVGWGGGV